MIQPLSRVYNVMMHQRHIFENMLMLLKIVINSINKRSVLSEKNKKS